LHLLRQSVENLDFSLRLPGYHHVKTVRAQINGSQMFAMLHIHSFFWADSIQKSWRYDVIGSNYSDN
jgi:hypothetical protein